MAGGSGLLDGEQDGIAVAIDANLKNFLSMAAFFAFSPKFTAGCG